MASSKAAVRVGAVVLLALILLGGVAFFFSNAGLKLNTYRVDVVFTDALGIKEGADVLLAGVKVGNVEKVRLARGDQGYAKRGQTAILTLRIHKEVDIPRGADWTITSGGLIGEYYVQIEPPVHTAASFLSKTTPEQVRGIDLPSFDALRVQAANLALGGQKIVQNLERTTNRVAKLAADPQLERALRRTSANVEAASEQAAITSKHINNLIASEEPALRATLDNVRAASKGVQPILANANHLVNDLRDTLAYVNETLRGVDAGGSLKSVLANFQSASSHLNAISKNAEQITSDLAHVTGNPETTQNLQDTMRNVKDISEKVNGLLNKFSGLAGKKGPKLGLSLKPISQLEAYQNLNDHGRFRADYDIIVPRGRDFYLLGIRDIGETNKLNLQKGVVLAPKLTMRYGFHAGKLGVGTDYGLTGPNSLSADLYSPNSPQLDVYARRQITQKLGVALGFEDVVHESRPTVGLTYRP